MRAIVYGGIGGLFSVVICVLLLNGLGLDSGGAEFVMMLVVFALPGVVIGCTQAILEEIRAAGNEAATDIEKEPTTKE